MTYRQEAMKNTRSSKWKNNNTKDKNDIVKYGFVITLIKIVEYNDPEALGTVKKPRKTDLSLTMWGQPVAVEISLTAWQGLWLPFQPLS